MSPRVNTPASSRTRQAARAPSPVAQFCHPAQLSAPGPKERWMLATWGPVWEVPGSWGMHSTAWSQLSRWNRAHALSGQQHLKNKGPRASPTRAIMCEEALFGPHCPVRDAGGARGRWAVVNRSPPAHSKWLAPAPPGSQNCCYGLPGRLPWVTGPRKRERAWDGGSVRAAEPRPTGVGAEL